MKHFWLWCKWLAKGRACYRNLKFRIENLEGRPETDATRFAALEKAIAEMQAANAEELHEIRERLDGRVKRNSPHRTFQQMRAIAEMGEAAMRKQKEQANA